MKSTLTASDVLADIEFELMQGAISRDEFGRSLQAVRQHQNKIRQELFGDQQEVDLKEALSRQFQINDMLLTLLQEMSGGFVEMQQQISWVGQARGGTDQSTAARLARAMASHAQPDELRSTLPLVEAARQEFLHQKMDMQPNGRPIPILNGIIRRLRTGLHNLVLFYVNKLGKEQTAVNQLHADWIQHLNALVRHQQEEIQQLTRQVAELQDKSAAP